ncbi:Rrf2 family transcriptional regulator [Micromonospora sp. NPDC005367]|uniref:Rrf2 family transcriptional regulator n=1 Tax=Micromonospora sp. NPDC005367 TaxID=3155590 RepID=UPI0033B14132
MELARRRGREVLTSEEVAASVNTNAVIVRRSLGDLQRAGLVRARRGNGAGYSLARSATEITLLDVWLAVSPEPLLALHHGEPNPECPVGRGMLDADVPCQRHGGGRHHALHGEAHRAPLSVRAGLPVRCGPTGEPLQLADVGASRTAGKGRQSMQRTRTATCIHWAPPVSQSMTVNSAR